MKMITRIGKWEVVDRRGKTLHENKTNVAFVRRTDDPELYVLKTQKPDERGLQLGADGNEKEILINHTESFRREVEIAAQMDHPNIIRVVDYNTGKYPWMVTPFYSGGALENADFQDWTNQERRECFEQVCRAIRYVESFGYIKSDNNLNNILLKADGRTPVIADLERCQKLTLNTGADAMVELSNVFYELMTRRSFDRLKSQVREIEIKISGLEAELYKFESG